jgi:hypothetical protein
MEGVLFGGAANSQQTLRFAQSPPTMAPVSRNANTNSSLGLPRTARAARHPAGLQISLNSLEIQELQEKLQDFSDNPPGTTGCDYTPWASLRGSARSAGSQHANRRMEHQPSFFPGKIEHAEGLRLLAIFFLPNQTKSESSQPQDRDQTYALS